MKYLINDVYTRVTVLLSSILFLYHSRVVGIALFVRILHANSRSLNYLRINLVLLHHLYSIIFHHLLVLCLEVALVFNDLVHLGLIQLFCTIFSILLLSLFLRQLLHLALVLGALSDVFFFEVKVLKRRIHPADLFRDFGLFWLF